MRKNFLKTRRRFYLATMEWNGMIMIIEWRGVKYLN